LVASVGCVSEATVRYYVEHQSRDRDAVKSLTQDLQDADEQVWMDQRLAGGEGVVARDPRADPRL
jgi:hypothetical protein